MDSSPLFIAIFRNFYEDESMDRVSEYMLIDLDGVLRREEKQLSGVPEFFGALHRRRIQGILLSNGSRCTAEDLRSILQTFGVATDHMPDVLGSAEATALYLRNHPSDSMRVHVAGSEGLRKEIKAQNISLTEDSWNGMQWNSVPTDVVVGYGATLEDLNAAFNALHHGARFTATNPDPAMRNAAGEIIPANGANIDFLRGTGVQPLIIGKPYIGMAEEGLRRKGAHRSGSLVTVLGDTVEQDVALGNNLRTAGWNVRRWLVLTGVADELQAREAKVDALFEDLNHITAHLLDGVKPR